MDVSDTVARDGPGLDGAPEHGGDLAAARRLFPAAPEPWIDLSTGINPVAYPMPALAAPLWQRLPGKAEQEALLAAARLAYGVPARAGLVAAPGTQILIGLLPFLAPSAAEVAVVGPTYAEHARAWRRAGFPVREAASLQETGPARVVVLVNPNNPDGRIAPAASIHAVAERLAAKGGLLVVDEAFADLEAGASIVPALPPATVVLRSFGKAYGLAGLRLGFAVAAPALAAALEDRLGPWAVSGPALHIGAAALADRGWLDAARAARKADAERLDGLLARAGRVVGGTCLFRLLEAADAPALFARLGRCGIHVRRFRCRPERLRFGLPGSEEGWKRLAAALGG